MKPDDIRNMTADEIQESVITMKEKLFKIRQESTTHRVERPHRIGQLKHDIARCHTILKEKQSEGK